MVEVMVQVEDVQVKRVWARSRQIEDKYISALGKVLAIRKYGCNFRDGKEHKRIVLRGLCG